MKKNKIIKFHNIKFYDYDINTIFKLIMNGGYLVAPAASALATININPEYHKSLINSNIAILDSGFFCVLLKVFKFKKVNKLSGYKFIKFFLNKKEITNKKILLINPSLDEGFINREYLIKKNFKKIKNYHAPIYKRSNVVDNKLLKIIKNYKPEIVIINIAGGVQEILGHYIYNSINFKITIICSGAAIGFFTGSQAPINDFWDKFYCGWLIRFIYNPRRYFFRTLKSFSLIKLFI